MLACLHLELIVVDLFFRQRYHGYAFAVQLLLQCFRQTLLRHLARSREDTEYVGLAFALIILHSTAATDADTRAEGRTAQHAHTAAVAVFHAVAHRASTACGLYEDIPFIAVARVGKDGFHPVVITLHVGDVCRTV